MNTIKNSVRLIGNLGANPEVKEFESGKKVVRASIATSETYYSPDESSATGKKKVEETQWHSLVFWGKQAELAEKLLTKGKEVAIEGRLTHRSYQAKTGEKKYITEVVVNEIVLMNKANPKE
ncbi:MAG: single-stranded DNA-binding protein [Bacteroidetes bacterium]|nr:single-stranded DNA-binding protein [Bacteroidota bacterium]